jgi:hypothetical protein
MREHKVRLATIASREQQLVRGKSITRDVLAWLSSVFFFGHISTIQEAVLKTSLLS